MNRRRLLTVSYYSIWPFAHIEPIYNDIGVRRKRGCYGEDGEEHENNCESAGDAEVHACVIETECRCVRLLAPFIGLPTESERSNTRTNCE